MDISGLAASNDRKQVSQFIVEHFAHFNIYAVQFIGTCAKMTFALEVSKQQVTGRQIVHINGVQSTVRGGGPCVQNVLVCIHGFSDYLRCSIPISEGHHHS